MSEIIEKLKRLSNLLNQEGFLGEIILFVLIKRTDLENKSDIIISATGIQKNNSQEDLKYLIEKVKEVFNNELSFLSEIYLLTKEEKFIVDLANALPAVQLDSVVYDLQLNENFLIEQMYVITSNFSQLNLVKDLKQTESVATIEESF